MEAGVAHQTESFTATTPPTPDNNQWTAQAGYKLTHKLLDTVTLIHQLDYFPSMEQFSDYYLSTSGELRANFTEHMFSSFKAIMNRDSSPANGKGSTDTKYIISVGMTF